MLQNTPPRKTLRGGATGRLFYANIQITTQSIIPILQDIVQPKILGLKVGCNIAQTAPRSRE
jgi:hypothetical protein